MNTDGVVWQCAGASALGSSHRIQGLVNQDAIRFEVGDDQAIVAVADGHGSAKCFRSQRGSRLAVDIAASLGVAADHWFDVEVAERPAIVRSQFIEPLVAAWHSAVRADAADDPFTDEELAARGLDRAAAESDPLLAYGTTLLVASTRGAELVLAQIGDGDLVVATNEGIRKPVPADERLAASATTSLSDPSAAALFRVSCGKVGPEATALVLLATDGYGNSFEDPHWADHVAGDLLGYIGDHGLAWIDDQLGDWLIDSAEIAGDDVTVALLCRAAPATPVAHPVRIVVSPTPTPDPTPMPTMLGSAPADPASEPASEAPAPIEAPPTPGPSISPPEPGRPSAAAPMRPSAPLAEPPAAHPGEHDARWTDAASSTPTAGPLPPATEPHAPGPVARMAPPAPQPPGRTRRGLAIGAGLAVVLALVAGGAVLRSGGGSEDPTAAVSATAPSTSATTAPSTTAPSTTVAAIDERIIAESTLDALGLEGRLIVDLAPLGTDKVLALLDDGTAVVLRRRPQGSAPAAIAVESNWPAPEATDPAAEPTAVGAGGTNRWAAKGTTLIGQSGEDDPASSSLPTPIEFLAVTGDGTAWVGTSNVDAITAVASPGAQAAEPTPIEGTLVALAAAGDQLWALVDAQKMPSGTGGSDSEPSTTGSTTVDVPPTSSTSTGTKPGANSGGESAPTAMERTLIRYQADGTTLLEQGRLTVSATGTDLAAGSEAVVLSSDGVTTIALQPGSVRTWSDVDDPRALAVAGDEWWVADQRGASIMIVNPS